MKRLALTWPAVKLKRQGLIKFSDYGSGLVRNVYILLTFLQTSTKRGVKFVDACKHNGGL